MLLYKHNLITPAGDLD